MLLSVRPRLTGSTRTARILLIVRRQATPDMAHLGTFGVIGGRLRPAKQPTSFTTVSSMVYLLVGSRENLCDDASA
jgi:hypothetical protein